MKNCPCCKVLRTMDEAIKHPSITSVQAGRAAIAPFNEQDPEARARLIVAIFPCPVHSAPGGYEGFLVEFNRRKPLLRAALAPRPRG